MEVGADAIHNPEMLFDLLLVDLNEGNGKALKPFLDEYVMAHRQREDAIGMAAEDADASADIATPAPKPKAKKRTRNNLIIAVPYALALTLTCPCLCSAVPFYGMHHIGWGVRGAKIAKFTRNFPNFKSLF